LRDPSDEPGHHPPLFGNPFKLQQKMRVDEAEDDDPAVQQTKV
jgi:hypothetical protein